MTAADDETLFSALALIRAAPALDRGDRQLAPAWLLVVDWLARRLRGRTNEDVRQDALVKIMRKLDQCDARNAASASAWVLRVARRTAIDHDRGSRSSAIDKAVRGRPGDDDGLEDIAGIESISALPETAIDDLAAELEEALERAVVERYGTPTARILPRAQARARLYRRLLGRSVKEVREMLDWHVPLTDDAVSKWIERGQAPLQAAIRHWVAFDAGERAELGDALRRALGERREDAGRPRPDRRTRPDGSGRRLSVVSSGARRWSCGPPSGRAACGGGGLGRCLSQRCLSQRGAGTRARSGPTRGGGRR